MFEFLIASDTFYVTHSMHTHAAHAVHVPILSAILGVKMYAKKLT